MIDLQELVRDPGAVARVFEQFGAKEHPLVKLPTGAQVAAMLAQPGGADRLRSLLMERQQGLELMENDPLRHGFELPWWKDARKLIPGKRRVLILGGNDSAKTWFNVKYGIEQLVTIPGIDWAFFHSTEESSVNQQQLLAYKFLPPEWRDIGKQGKSIDVCWTEATGFKNNKFILPNGSRALFFFYKQDSVNLTGYKLKGASCDEIITQGILDELETRTLGNRGVIIMTFTPVSGYSVVVAQLLNGHTVAEYRPSKFLPGHNLPNVVGAPRGHMPYVLKCRKQTDVALCVFTEWSPFRKEGDLEELVKDKPSSYVKMRAYGWPEKQTGTAIAKFNDVHIIKRHGTKPPGPVPPNPWRGEGDLTAKNAKNTKGEGTSNIEHRTSNIEGGNGRKALYPQLGKVGTNYCVADPGGAKNWFIKWYRCVPLEGDRCFTYLYREWPDMASHGEWALPGDKHDGMPGPAMRSAFGNGIVAIKRLILLLEGNVWDEEKGRWDDSNAELIHERFIDPRMGGTEVPSAEEGTSLIELFEQVDVDNKGRVTGPSMIWYPAPGGSGSIANQTGIAMLNDWFDYEIQEPVTVLNCPKFYVVEDCEQSIYAYRTYTGLDGEKGALKDVMDPDWYMRKADVGHVDVARLRPRGGGSY